MQTLSTCNGFPIFFNSTSYDILWLTYLFNQESGVVMHVKIQYYGTTKNGEDIFAYHLIGENQFSATVLSFGGVISEIQAPDRNGTIQNLVLGYKSLKPYETFSPHFGALTGRVAGRINQGAFTLNNKTYALAQNNRSACLHGGFQGFAFQVYRAEPFVEEEICGVTLKRTSPHMEEGFPGNLALEASYSLSKKNELIIEYRATTDQTTPITLTNHSYFNLSGKPNTTIEDHLLTIRADHYGQINKDVVPTVIADVAATPFDFRSETRIGDALSMENEQLRFGKGFDHPFCLKEKGPQVSITDPKSGRTMAITTTEKCVVVYTGNFLSALPDENLSHGKRPHDYEGICFETQAFPDALHHPEVDSIFLKPGESYQSKTVYQFSTLSS